MWKNPKRLKAGGLGATSLEGRMIDFVSYQQAKEALENAQTLEEREDEEKGILREPVRSIRMLESRFRS